MSSSALWYLGRATGVVSLALLTLAVLLGIALAAKQRVPGLQRFVVRGMHRNVSLLAVAFLVVHIGTAVIDTYVPITVTDAVVPFVSRYEPLWLGFGTCAVDLLLAVLLTTLVRHRLGHRRWKAVHYLAYAAFPVAVAHSFMTGNDRRSIALLTTTVVCVVTAAAATAARVNRASTAAAESVTVTSPPHAAHERVPSR